MPPVSLTAGLGQPRDTVKPHGIGALYVDQQDGGLYIATGITDKDWCSVGGQSDANVPGVLANAAQVLIKAGTAYPALEYLLGTLVIPAMPTLDPHIDGALCGGAIKMSVGVGG